MSSGVAGSDHHLGLIKDLALVTCACLVGMCLAAAAIGFAPKSAIDPALRTFAADNDSRASLSQNRADAPCFPAFNPKGRQVCD